MKILSARQIRKVDQDTIKNDNISSIALMERAALVFADWIKSKVSKGESIIIFCGTGNNGGDGYAVARMLNNDGYNIIVANCEISINRSEDNKANRSILSKSIKQINVSQKNALPDLRNKVVIDAIFGSGLNRSVQGFWQKLMDYINKNAKAIYSIDIPSGIFMDKPSTCAIHADSVLSFEFPKLCFLLPDNKDQIESWEYKSIGLSKEVIAEIETPYHYIDLVLVQNLLKSKNKFDHKGDNGHSCIVAGELGKMGAAVLTAKACLRAGTGLLTLQIPSIGLEVMQSQVPEAMVYPTTGHDFIEKINIPKKVNAFGIGCGLGQNAKTQKALFGFLKHYEGNLVLDADALNLIGTKKNGIDKIPSNSILTPHLKEFQRLFGKSKDGFVRNKLQIKRSKELGIYIILKGAHTAISTPEGKCYFNSTGNPGMATGGSGDVLTGILTGLLAQGYALLDTCLLGVYLHGLAADIAVENGINERSLIASDIIDHISEAYNKIELL